MAALYSPVKPEVERESVLRLLAAASFLIFFSSYLFAPLIPSLVAEFHSSDQLVGLLVPAYLLPYGISTLFYGPISDRVGRQRILLALLGAMVVTTAGAAGAHSIEQLILWRAFAGVATGGIIPLGLALLGDLFPYEQRGRPLGWIFGAIAGGMAFGSTGGALLNPIIGWRSVCLALAAANAVVFLLGIRHRALLEGKRNEHPPGISIIIKNYLALLTHPRGRSAYSFITLNGMFHSGIFAWLGLYFSQRYGLGDRGIGLALLGYGVPGLLLGPIIGRLADRFGRRTIIPLGLLIAALCAAALAISSPLAWAAIIVTVLSLGFDMSHPLLAGIITSIDPTRRGQAMGLNAFVLFMGLGLGSLLFQEALHGGFGMALSIFAIIQLLASIAAVYIFRNETPTIQAAM